MKNFIKRKVHSQLQDSWCFSWSRVASTKSHYDYDYESLVQSHAYPNWWEQGIIVNGIVMQVNDTILMYGMTYQIWIS